MVFVISLSKWHNHPDSDATWIQENDLRHLDSSLLDCYIFSYSSESSYFQPKGNDGAWNRLIPRPRRDRKPKSNDNFIIISYLFNRTFWIYLLIYLIILLGFIH